MEATFTTYRYAVKAGIALHNWHLSKEGNVAPRRTREDRSNYFDYFNEDGQLIHGRYKYEDPEKELETFKAV